MGLKRFSASNLINIRLVISHIFSSFIIIDFPLHLWKMNWLTIILIKELFSERKGKLTENYRSYIYILFFSLFTGTILQSYCINYHLEFELKEKM
jgi:hypothetical protein